MRGYSRLFFSADKRVLSVHIRDYSSVGLGFFLFNMQAKEKGEKEENWSERFVYIIDWPLLRQGHHVMFLLTNYLLIQFTIEKNTS